MPALHARPTAVTPRANGKLDADFFCGWLKVTAGTVLVLAIIGAAINLTYYYFTGVWLP